MEYNIEYQENLLRLHARNAEFINGIRWKWIQKFGPETVLDYGCGPGFFRAYRPDGVEVDTFDVAPVMQTGIKRDHYDMICFWDVLEHIENHDILRPVFDMADKIACSVPIFENGIPLEAWKHYKPGEHLHNFDLNQLVSLLIRFNFECIMMGKPECPPRKDIYSFVFQNKKRS